MFWTVILDKLEASRMFAALEGAAQCRYIAATILGKPGLGKPGLGKLGLAGGLGNCVGGGYAHAMNSWCVYLLACADGTLYCGMTNDLPRRLAGHNAGRADGGAKYTSSRLPVALLASAPCADKGTALRLEIAVKKRPRGKKLAFLLTQPGAAAAASAAQIAAATEAGTAP